MADRRSTPTWQRAKIARSWWDRAHQAYVAYRDRPKWGVPSWFVGAMSCISDHEEYGYGGGTTIAGYFGFIYPPSSYQQPGPSIAASYGDSWLNVPLAAQLEMAYSLYLVGHNFSPWSTAGTCGLA